MSATTDRPVHERLETLYRAGNAVEAHAVANLLEGQGIAARVVGDAIEAGGFIAGHQGSDVLVKQSDADRARRLIAEAQGPGEAGLTPPVAWPRFSLRYLLLLTTVVALSAALLGLFPAAAWGTVVLSVLLLAEVCWIVSSSYRAVREALTSNRCEEPPAGQQRR